MIHKTRLVFLVTLPPPTHGSNQVNQYLVNNSELSHKYNVKVFPLRYVSSLKEIGRFQFNKYVRFLKYLIRLPLFLRSFYPDFVYFVPCVTGLPFFRDCLFALILKVFRIKIIYHLHGKGIKQNLNNHLLRKLYTWFFLNERIILLSPLLFDDVQDVVRKSQISYLANGVDIDYKCSNTHENRASDLPQILFLSNLIPTKGPIILLKACTILRDKGFSFKVCFVGSPSRHLSRRKFEHLVKLTNLEAHVTFLGPKYGREKCRNFEDSDIFVFPTYKDCFPLAILEAMAFGLPVISTHEGAISEIIDDGITGFVVPKHNSQALAEKLSYLIRCPSVRTQMGRAARRRFELNYTIEKFNKQFIQIIDSITQGPHSDDERTIHRA